MLDPAGVESPQQEHPFLFHKAGTRPRSDDERHDTQNWETRMSYAFRAQTTARNYYNDDGDAHHASSGYSSPPLWKTTANGPTCGRRSPCPSPPRQQRNHYRSLSPASRTQAIARGQQELMEMVKRMPESCYELSLKDLVEQPRQLEDHQLQQFRSTESDKELERRDSQRRRSYDGGSMRRSGRAEESGSGMLLKMVFPVSFGAKRKAKKKKTVAAKNNKEHLAANTSNMTAKVSPKPSNLVAENGGSKGSHSNGGGVDKEWWKKRYSVAGDQSSDQLSSSANSGSMKSSSGSRSSSISSRSSSIRQGRGGGCWWFIRGKKKSKEEE